MHIGVSRLQWEPAFDISKSREIICIHQKQLVCNPEGYQKRSVIKAAAKATLACGATRSVGPRQ